MEELETKNRILKAAENEFAEKGMSGARIDAIAKAAKINKAMLYYYFGNKEELYMAVLESTFAELASGVTRIIEEEHTHPVQMFRKYVDFYFKFLSEKPNMPRIMLRELASGSRYFREIASRVLFPIGLKAQEVIREGMDRGILNRVDPEMTIPVILAPIIFFFANRTIIEVLARKEGMTGEMAQSYKENFLNVILNGILKNDGGENETSGG